MHLITGATSPEAAPCIDAKEHLCQEQNYGRNVSLHGSKVSLYDHRVSFHSADMNLNSSWVGPQHKVHIYQEYQCLSPRTGTPPPPTPSSANQCAPLLPEPKVGGVHTRLRVRGWGSPDSDD